MPNPSTTWRTRNVWAIALSACFADLGYQSVMAGFPLLLVLVLHQQVWVFGLAMALAYGGGSLISYLGGRLGDRYGHRHIALLGNSVIPLLSLSALVYNPVWAIGLLCGGWWARNLRSPSRRVMLTEAAPDPATRSSAFGFLHALDVGGGVLAAIYVLIAISLHLQFRWIFLGTALPLIASTISLSLATTGKSRSEPNARRKESAHTQGPASPGPSRGEGADNGDTQGTDPEEAPWRGALPASSARAILAATALFGFTSYSIGFPVLTVSQGYHSFSAGIGAFLLFQAVSAATGYLLGGHLGKTMTAQLRRLGLVGYLGAGVGAALIAIGYEMGKGGFLLFLGVAIIGFALGVIETLEPTLISRTGLPGQSGRAFGALSAYRSAGVFAGNLIMGLLYSLGAAWSYGYASIVAGIAALIIIITIWQLPIREEQKSTVS